MPIGRIELGRFFGIDRIGDDYIDSGYPEDIKKEESIPEISPDSPDAEYEVDMSIDDPNEPSLADTTKDIVEKADDYIDDNFGKTGEVVTDVVGDVGKGIGKVFGDIAKGIGNFFNGGVGKFVGSVASGVKKVFSGLWKSLSGFFGKDNKKNQENQST